MNIKEIKEMLALMNENNLTEMEFEKDGMRIKLKKASSGEYEVSSTAATKEVVEAKKVQSEETKASLQGAGLMEIKAPMVGTFYRAPSPESAPFIEVGQNITAGQIIWLLLTFTRFFRRAPFF